MGQAYPLAVRFSVKGCREQPLFIWLAACGMLLPFDKDLLERRLVAWKEVVGTNYDNFPIGLICVCSDHFQSGKPANICNVNDIDWIPSKNLDLLVANKTRNTENANDDHSQNSNGRYIVITNMFMTANDHNAIGKWKGKKFIGKSVIYILGRTV
ncbi:hypothetical protein OUZ56_003019 [Daphnia magna]|uniref:THAP-type domain-containing protein n=1 Tax=Daphnia magna TaxID=35525 RepID=A0ABR0A7J4_9CRUS|nr:hypothetical protein OUZ56_003019 [Daphnia magna]